MSLPGQQRQRGAECGANQTFRVLRNACKMDPISCVCLFMVAINLAGLSLGGLICIFSKRVLSNPPQFFFSSGRIMVTVTVTVTVTVGAYYRSLLTLCSQLRSGWAYFLYQESVKGGHIFYKASFWPQFCPNQLRRHSSFCFSFFLPEKPCTR